jgi:hypothetical protein
VIGRLCPTRLGRRVAPSLAKSDSSLQAFTSLPKRNHTIHSTLRRPSHDPFDCDVAAVPTAVDCYRLPFDEACLIFSIILPKHSQRGIPLALRDWISAMGNCGSTACCKGICHHHNMIWKKIANIFRTMAGRSRDGLYEPVLADSEREAVADLLQYLENVSQHREDIGANTS